LDDRVISCKETATRRVYKGVQEETVKTEGELLPPTCADLYAQAYPSMVRLARLLIGSPELAADMVQDAFVDVYRRWDRIVQPSAYLRRAVVNRCRGHNRRRRVERRHRPQPPPPVSLEAHELTDALSALRYRERAAIVLRFYADLPDDEIAALLGCRPGTVAALVHRGLERLRRSIQP